MDPVRVSPRVVIPPEALSVRAVRSSGPGGQHVNKTATKIELRVDLARIEGLTEAQRRRLLSKVRGRLDEEGRLLVVSQQTRSQRQNLLEAIERVRTLVAAALPEPRRRIPTRPGRGARARRVDEKRRQSEKKQRRRWEPE